MRQRRRTWLALGILAVGAIAIAIAIAGNSGHGHGVNGVAVPSTSTVTPTSTVPVRAPPVTLPGPPAQPPPSGLLIGANVNRLFENTAFSVPAIDAQLERLRAAGATIARENALWDASEPGPPTGGEHHYDWTFDDRVASALAAHGLQWLAIIDYSPGWAKSTPAVVHSPPASFDDYAAYAVAFILRYGPHGTFWAAHPRLSYLPVQTLELWNEPDNAVFWGPAPDPARYAQLYLLTRAAILRSQPHVRVIVGGLWHPDRFLAAMVAAEPGLVGHLDGVAIHPYSGTPGGIVANVADARHELGRLRLAGAALYITEFGWTTSPPGALNYLPAALRPGYLQGTLALLGHVGCGIAAITAYTWVTEQQNPANPEQWYGIDPVAGAPGADAAAFAAGIHAAAHAPPASGPC